MTGDVEDNDPHPETEDCYDCGKTMPTDEIDDHLPIERDSGVFDRAALCGRCSRRREQIGDSSTVPDDLDEPEVRVHVWRPRTGSDYETFDGDTLDEALDHAWEFVSGGMHAAQEPVIAFDGAQFDIPAYAQYVEQTDADAPLPSEKHIDACAPRD